MRETNLKQQYTFFRDWCKSNGLYMIIYEKVNGYCITKALVGILHICDNLKTAQPRPNVFI